MLYGDTSKEAAAYRLKVARKVTKWSQTKLAEAAGLQKAAVQQMERGRVFPSRAVMNVLYEKFEIDYNWLMVGDHRRLPAEVLEKIQQVLEVFEEDPPQSSSQDEHA